MPGRGPRAAWLCALLIAGPAYAQNLLPPAIDVAVPNGGTLHIALPPTNCTYPPEVRARLAEFLAKGEPRLRLLGASGDCKDIERLMRDGTTIVSHSLQLAMLDSEADPAPRSTPAAYRRACFERFPKQNDEAGSPAFREAIKRAERDLSLGEERSIGLVAATRDAVFGGMVTELARASHQLLLLQVTACFAPRDVPVLWTFQAAVPRDAKGDEIVASFRGVLDLAQAQVKATMALNFAASGSP